MTIRPGTYQQLIGTSSLLNGSAGVLFPLPTASFGVLISVRGAVTTTATVGNRQIIFRILDSLNNVLFESPSPNLQTATTTVRYQCSAGVPAVVGGGVQTVPSPVEMPIPAGAKIGFLDSANIDVNDTVQPNIIWCV